MNLVNIYKSSRITNQTQDLHNQKLQDMGHSFGLTEDILDI
jgi:hypothetical protein